MNDLDLLCHKEDEAGLRAIFEQLGGVQAKAPGGAGHLAQGALRDAVDEKINHPPPFWFAGITRIEVHYHLLSRNLVDDGRLLEALWSQAQPHDWDGLEVRSLGPEHQVLHLASHLGHHLREGKLSYYWLTDLREVLGAHRAGLGPERLCALARSLGLERDCARAFGLLGEPWDSEPDPAGAARTAAALARAEQGAGTAALSYLGAIRQVRHLRGPWNRLRYLLGLVFPPPAKLVLRYRTRSRLAMPFLYLADPFVRTAVILTGLARRGLGRFRS
jgi:hypothetical protein